MRCEQAQEAILALGRPDEELSAHVGGCQACRRFYELQQSLDRQLREAYIAPGLSPAFRTGIQTRIGTERREQRWEALPAVIAPGAGLVTSGVCALVVPEMAMFFLTVGLALSAVGYVGQLLFVWLTEELGEG